MNTNKVTTISLRSVTEARNFPKVVARVRVLLGAFTQEYDMPEHTPKERKKRKKRKRTKKRIITPTKKKSGKRIMKRKK